MMKSILILSSLASVTALAAPALARDSTVSVSAASAGNLSATAGVVVVSEPVAPRARADSLFYIRLGQGVAAAPGAPTGPGIGLGYRLELGHVGLDASMNLAVTNVMNADKRGFVGSLAKLTAQYYFMPDADKSPYLGGGVSWGFRSLNVGADRYAGNGLQAEIVGGYEFLRNSNIRAFIQAGVSLPLYLVNRENVAGTTARSVGPGTRYLPTMGLSFGVAWGK
jgi:hypothetical protein